MAIYLHLFHGRATLEEEMDDWGEDGPVLGPFTFAQVTYASTLRCAQPDGREAWFDLRDGCVFYGGVWYGDFTVLSEDALLMRKAQPFDKAKAALTKNAQ